MHDNRDFERELERAREIATLKEQVNALRNEMKKKVDQNEYNFIKRAVVAFILAVVGGFITVLFQLINDS